MTIAPMTTGVVEILDKEDETTSRHFARNISWTPETFEWVDVDLPEDNGRKSYAYLSAVDQGDHIAVDTESQTIRVRPLDPYDGVQRSGAGVAQPLDVMQAEVLRGGGVVAQELTAVVAPDNTVVTLLLETGLGLYVRFSGDWQLLSSDSAALEDTFIMPVSPEAVEVFDKADMASVTLSAFDLPRVETLDNGVDIQITPEPVGLPAVFPENGGAVTAAGSMIPTVDTVDDLDVAIRVASAHPDARWYVVKRAKALGAEERVPAGWIPQTVVRPF